MSFFTTFSLMTCLLTNVPFVQSSTLISSLAQNQTNGVSNLGTLSAPQLPQFLTNNPLPDGYPWGLKNVTNTDPYEEPPVTNVTRSYHFVIERAIKAPDGVNKSVILVNGQFPGPTIKANWGDIISVTVDNQIQNEGTSLHWHGFLQKESPWYDGVPSVQQCPIAPNNSFTYSFKADLYGTSWYHSHYSAQYADGLLGPIVILGPNTTNTTEYQVDLGPVLLNDWYYQDYYSIVKTQEVPGANPPAPPASNNNLINGKGNASCSQVPQGFSCVPNAGLSKFTFQKGKTHRLRLINAGAEALQRFTIDNHEMTIIANDFVPVKPYKTNVVTLGVGQRTDVLVTANDNNTDPVWMRSDISAHCSVKGQQPNALAAIYYENTDTSVAPTSTKTLYDDSHCGNDPLNKTIPVHVFTPPAVPAVTQEINITFAQNETQYWGWNMNGSPFRANYDDPLLDLAYSGNTSYPYDPQWNVYNFGQNSSIRIVLRNFFPNVSHPMHLHGHNFYVVAEGVGDWDGTVNSGNVQRRDTQILQGAADAETPGYLVVEFVTDNPGVWPFHCHIAWHVSSGLYVNIMERPSDITQSVIPSITNQTCNAWANFAAHDFVDQIDSGL